MPNDMNQNDQNEFIIEDDGREINPDDIIIDVNIRGDELVPLEPAQNVAPARRILNGNRTSSFAERVKSNKGKDKGHCCSIM